MDAPTLRLSNDDLRRIVEDVDAVEAVAAVLIARSRGNEHRRQDWTVPAGSVTVGSVTAGSVTVDSDRELAVYEPAGGGQRCTMPAAGLREYRLAVLTVLATRHLVAPGAVTASVIGSRLALELQLAALRTHVSDISHVAVATVGSRLPDQAVFDLLDREGIGVSMVTTHADAVFGANLVVLAGLTRLNAPRLAKGAVLVNTTGVDLPSALIESVNAVYVDDLARLADSDRPFASAQPARQPGRGRRFPAVAGDLGQVLAGEHPGRTDHDHVLLVELIGGGAELDAILAGRIHQAAIAAGLGTFARH
jgi:ornithine cyclodeaminase/alanine dehydrogenase-like protein (mu-crystallin family)